MKNTDLPTPQRVQEYLQHDNQTGQIWWKKRPSNSVNMKEPAGYINNLGYNVIKFEGKNRQGHRLAWVLNKGRWPKKGIDHSNHDKTDNRIENLRESTPAQSGQNRRKQKNNTSGYTGVYPVAGGKWEVRLTVNRKKMYFGRFTSLKKAVEVRKAAARKYHKEFAYTS